MTMIDDRTASLRDVAEADGWAPDYEPVDDGDFAAYLAYVDERIAWHRAELERWEPCGCAGPLAVAS